MMSQGKKDLSKTKAANHALLQSITARTQPTLFYPQNKKQQEKILKKGRHCFFVDLDTKQLIYINSYGTVIPIPYESSLLMSESLKKMKKDGEQLQLEYKKPHHKTSDFFALSLQDDPEMGPGFSMTNDQMKTLIPEHLPVDPIIKLVQEKLQFFHVEDSLSGSFALFSKSYKPKGIGDIVGSLPKALKPNLQTQNAILIQLKEILDNKPTRILQKFKQEPQPKDFLGKGPNVYVFYEDPDQHIAKFWHVDRSQDEPVFTPYPLEKKSKAVESIRAIFDKDFKKIFDRKTNKNQNQWLKIGAESKQQDSAPGTETLRLSVENARKIPELLLGDLPAAEHLMADWGYQEANNRLTDVIQNTESTSTNERLLNRCKQIQTLLDIIGKDVWDVFPNTRGIVPIEIRKKILEGMTEMIKDPSHAKASPFFRTQHRVYHEPYSVEKSYEPSSFVWNHDELVYIDEYGKAEDLQLTPKIKEKFLECEAILHSNVPMDNQVFISAKDVYYLMTKPRLATHRFSQFVPPRFDRSEGFHTGTAQEMLYEVYDMEMSVNKKLYEGLKGLLLTIAPIILTVLGLTFPLSLILITGLFAALVRCFFIAWQTQALCEFARCVFLKNELVQPELNQLDILLKDLAKDVEHMQQFSLDDFDEGETDIKINREEDKNKKTQATKRKPG